MKSESHPTPNYEMNGFIVTYNSSKPKDITRINYYLFGRVVQVKKDNKVEKYYYPGLFENQQFKKISNGCYFVGSVADNFDGLLVFHPAVVTFSDDRMQTAKEFWKDKIKGKVHNW